MIENKLKNIKEKKPNAETVKQIEILLDQAKSGELKSLVYLAGWDDDAVSHGWSIDAGNSKRRLLAELVMLQHDVVVNIELFEGDSVLALKFTEA